MLEFTVLSLYLFTLVVFIGTSSKKLKQTPFLKMIVVSGVVSLSIVMRSISQGRLDIFSFSSLTSLLEGVMIRLVSSLYSLYWYSLTDSEVKY